jgi:diacylglycerol kinase (ATP)
MNIKLIFNPEAGNKKIDLNNIIKFFENKKHTIKLFITQKKGDARKFVSKKDSYDTIVIIGGDGTLNEVINGLQNYHVKIGLIPSGTENVLSKELKIPLNVQKACEIIHKGKTITADIGSSNETKFLFVVGVGFDAHAIRNVNTRLKKIFGKHSYKIAAIKTLFQHKAEELTITINKKKTKAYFAIITNIKKYAGNILVAPNAEFNDGQFELCLFKNKDIWSTIKYLTSISSGKLSNNKDMEIYQITTATIESKIPVLYHTDAEIGGTTPLKIKILRQKLNIIVP